MPTRLSRAAVVRAWAPFRASAPRTQVPRCRGFPGASPARPRSKDRSRAACCVRKPLKVGAARGGKAPRGGKAARRGALTPNVTRQYGTVGLKDSHR